MSKICFERLLSSNVIERSVQGNKNIYSVIVHHSEAYIIFSWIRIKIK